MRVLFGGVFDLLHYGHLMQIKRAKEYGYLILNVSSDKQARNKKGGNRPIIPQEERCALLRELRDVDEVICLDTEKLHLPYLLDIVKPDILITNEGNDGYDKECEKRNIKLIKFPRIVAPSGLDTTQIINKIKK